MLSAVGQKQLGAAFKDRRGTGMERGDEDGAGVDEGTPRVQPGLGKTHPPALLGKEGSQPRESLVQ